MITSCKHMKKICKDSPTQIYNIEYNSDEIQVILKILYNRGKMLKNKAIFLLAVGTGYSPQVSK
jgi:hypothetical protein